MRIKSMLASALLGVSLLSAGSALAACPAGKQGGGTWCSGGWEWKCERCGSEYCSIMTGRKCMKDDEQSASLRSTPLGRMVLAGAPSAPLPRVARAAH